MFGLTFLEPMFLLGLLAAPLPVLIHLFQRRRARVVDWSTLDFVRPLEHPRRRRVDPRRLLLLAVRVLALVLFALSLARPSFTGGAAAAGAPADAVVILDASLSMGSRAGGSGAGSGATLFDEARAKTAGILDLLRKGDQAALIVAGVPDAQAGASGTELVEDLAPLRACLGEARPSSGRLSWADALARAEQIFAASHGVNRELFLVSDFQASGWEEDVSLATGALAAKKVRVFPVPVGPLPGENLSLDQLRMEPAAGGVPRVGALVRNQGKQDANGVALELDIEGSEAGAAREASADAGTAVASIPRGGATWTTIAAAPGAGSTAGEPLRGRVSLPSDACPADNTRWFARSGAGVTRVLLAGQPSPASPGNLTTHFLKELLAPSAATEEAGATAPAAKPAFQVTETSDADLTSEAIGAADVVLLADCDALSASAVDAIGRGVSAGHGLFIFVGPGTDIGFMDRVLLPGLMNVELAAGEAGGAGGAGFGWGETDRHHPIFGVFPEGPADAFGRVRFTSCLSARPGKDVRVIASFANGLPALLEAEHGEGRILLFASSAVSDWGNLPLSGNFLALVHEAVLYLAGNTQRPPDEYLVGQTARRVLPPGAPEDDLLLRAPDGATTPLVAAIAGGSASVTAGPLARPGLYSILRAGAAVDWFAVNVDPRESALQALDAGAIAAHLAPLRPDAPDGGEMTGAVLAGRFGRELRPPLLWAVFLLLVAEILIRGSFALRAEQAAA